MKGFEKLPDAESDHYLDELRSKYRTPALRYHDI